MTKDKEKQKLVYDNDTMSIYETKDSYIVKCGKNENTIPKNTDIGEAFKLLLNK